MWVFVAVQNYCLSLGVIKKIHIVKCPKSLPPLATEFFDYHTTKFSVTIALAHRRVITIPVLVGFFFKQLNSACSILSLQHCRNMILDQINKKNLTGPNDLIISQIPAQGLHGQTSSPPRDSVTEATGNFRNNIKVLQSGLRQ